MAARFVTVSWDQLHRDARSLAGQLIADAPFAGIVAITRGGLIPAAIIGRELDCRVVESVSVVSYDHATVRAPRDAPAEAQALDDERRQGEPVVVKPPAAAGDGSGFLIIDDLVDSGVTARLVRRLLPRARFACLYAKPAGLPFTDRFVLEVPQDTWILFPWDTAPSFVPPLARQAVDPA